ncbi:TonB-dependent receptor domain-containing protein [Niveispirillum sp. KHB5.9]|uniref:TonB-dependent receptor domain-containing protein n=1 Tax=Niveispirillum sp. KHB5.9 TaxID=3400269 RepID=UPI003A88D767
MKQRLALALMTGISLTALGAARAQDTGAPLQLEEIVVTGSRIARPETTTSQPVQTLDGAVINNRGFQTAAEAINEMPSIGISDTPRGDQAGNSVGRNYINMFNLGSQRTLTLVNGRRFVSSNPLSTDGASPGNQVDLNNIPAAMIKRIETVQATGASVYGSDAIAGVVNLILKDNFEGAEVDAQAGISDRGDHETYRVSAIVGGNFDNDRGNLTFAYERSRERGLLNTDRAATARATATPGNAANTGPSDGRPAAITINDHRLSEFNRDGVLFTAPAPVPALALTIPDPNDPTKRVRARFDANGNIVPYNVGTYYTFAYASGGEGYSLADVTALVSPVERNVAYINGHYDLTERVKLSFEGSASWVDATEPANQGEFNTTLQTGSSAALRITTENGFLTDQARSVLAAQGRTAFFLSRALDDVLPDDAQTVAKSDTQRAVLGLDGTFDLGERELFWNASGVYGHTGGHYSTIKVNQARFTNAVDAVKDASGKVVCRVTRDNPGSTNVDIANCKPLNLFGYGAPSDEARDYINALFRQDYSLDQAVGTLNLGGDIFSLPAGEVRTAIGFEHRYEKSVFSPDDNSRNGIGRDVPVIPARGSYDTNEFYGELLVPVIDRDMDIPLVRNFEIEGSIRYIDHSLTGTDTAWNIGERWQVTSDLMVRASNSRTFRSPSALELFLPRSSISASGQDPCDSRYVNGGANPTARLANCAALYRQIGLASGASFTSLISNVPRAVTNGGDAGLKPEVADSWTLGTVITPSFVPNLTLTADWVDIKIKDAITTFDLTAIFSTCYDSPNPDPAICGRITRDAAGQVIDALLGYVNAGYTDFEALTLTGDYRFALEDVGVTAIPGEINLNAMLQYTSKLETSVSGLGYDLDSSNGEYTNPKWKGRFSVGYTDGTLGLAWTTNYLSSAVYNVTYTAEDRDILGVGDYFRHDLTGSYVVNDNLTLRAGVTNVFDREPSYPLGYVGSYDIIGRSFFIGAKASIW